MDTTKAPSPSLQEYLSLALPTGTKLSVRYVHTRPKSCEPLFSPLHNETPERTTLTSHFLTVSSCDGPSNDTDVLVYAVEVLVYSTRNLTTLFISKADSTGYLTPTKPSSIKLITTAFLKWLSDQDITKRPGRKQVISLFARAQGQYLFPGSVENVKKHVLDDRQLIKWWARVLDPLLQESAHRRRAYITVPGYSGVELTRFLPPAREQWEIGHPLYEIARARKIPEHAPTRCLLPRFPDDPKARFMQDLDDEVGLMEDAGGLATTSPSKRKSGRWKSIHDLERFWEAMEFRQECSSGRSVGFLWLVTDSETNNNDLQESSTTNTSFASSQTAHSKTMSSHKSVESNAVIQTKKKKQKLTGPIIPRSPRIKGSSNSVSKSKMENKFDGDGVCLTTDGYEQAMQTLLHLDFAHLSVATRSTSKWTSEVSSICSLPRLAYILQIHGQANVIQSHVLTEAKSEVNDLGSMIRKKKRPLVEDESGAQSVPAVNVLGNGLIRKKPKP